MANLKLSRNRIVDAAVAILDMDGEAALTFRALAAKLATGAGAIYWHVADKEALLAAATDDVIARALQEVTDADPRAVAMAVYDAIDAHPWLGTQLARVPWQLAMGRVFEQFGRRLDRLIESEDLLFEVTSALINYVLGAAAHTAAVSRLAPTDTDSATVLSRIVERWTASDPNGFPFVHRMSSRLTKHDDRVQFQAGMDLILAGIGNR